MPTATAEQLATGVLVAVRGKRWVVSEVEPGPAGTLVRLQSVEYGRYGHMLDAIWEVEPRTAVLSRGTLPDVTETGFDAPEKLAAFLDAVRWSAVTSADVKTLQAPFRSGVAIESYQLEPVARAVDAPRVNLLLADDVGLGKTIEAGLVAQELLLRQRARRIMVVCPAGLTIKWKDEMAEKFGLDFTIVDSERCAIVRRARGSAANPFEVYPLTIVSLPWLRGRKAQRLLSEVLPQGEPGTKRTFDLLILDEAHHVAPAAPKQAYAVDSQQTRLIRRLAPHFTHRLFLSATPHNGYQASYTALLEILDNQRFARGVDPDRKAVEETLVRRLKTQVTDDEDRQRFLKRVAKALPVAYPVEEREIHGLMKQFSELRAARMRRKNGRRSADLVTLLLKKRLFSSPAAFARTIDVYLATVRSTAQPDGPDGKVAREPDDAWIADFIDESAILDDEPLAEAENDAVVRVGSGEGGPTEAEVDVLQRMRAWALKHQAKPDAKARELLEYLRAVCMPEGGRWSNERVVVFTEYRDTLDWLERLFHQEGLSGAAVATMHGGKSAQEREMVRLAFQKDPTEHRVRILLATDAAGEGIDLQDHCHRLVNYDIPFNPNKLEQRIGRIDRYGQRHVPEIYHFVGVGWDKAADSSEADLEFLARVARKIAQMETDLGPVNAVISDRVQRRMLGEHVSIDNVDEETPRPDVPAERDVREQTRRLRADLVKTVDELRIIPDNVKRVVDTALDLARQQPLAVHIDDKHLVEGLWTVPTLTDSWERAGAGLLERATREGQELRRRPVTFDPEVAAQCRDDAVLAHLNHPLVEMSTRLLRAAISDEKIGLRRVTAVVSDDPELETTLIGAYSTFVLVGGDGVRLHEEVLHAGGFAPPNGRFRRLENLTTLRRILDRALGDGLPASPQLQARLAEQWPRMREGVRAAMRWRGDTRGESLANALAKRQESEQHRIIDNLEQFAATLRTKLAENQEDEEDALFSRASVEKDAKELAQYRQDRQSWENRLAQLAEERDRELEAIAARYRDPQSHRFPVALVFVVPEREAATR